MSLSSGGRQSHDRASAAPSIGSSSSSSVAAHDVTIHMDASSVTTPARTSSASGYIDDDRLSSPVSTPTNDNIHHSSHQTESKYGRLESPDSPMDIRHDVATALHRSSRDTRPSLDSPQHVHDKSSARTVTTSTAVTAATSSAAPSVHISPSGDWLVDGVGKRRERTSITILSGPAGAGKTEILRSVLLGANNARTIAIMNTDANVTGKHHSLYVLVN